MEIASGQGSDARDQVNSNEKAIAALGRSRGVLSAALNSFSSGSFILSVADAATSVIHAQNIVISILVIVAEIIIIALGELTEASLLTRIISLSIVGIGITIFV